MSAYNKTKVEEFIRNPQNRELLSKLNKFKKIDLSNENLVINTMKLQKESVKRIHNFLLEKNKNAIINIKKDDVKFFTAKCFDDFENSYKGTVSYTTNTFSNDPNKTTFDVMLNKNYFNCRDSNKYKRVIIATNKYNMTLLNFSTSNYSGRSLYRYILTKFILGNDYNPQIVADNPTKYSGFYKDGTLGQLFIYYFLEVYCYDRFNFFKNMATEDYQLIRDIRDRDLAKQTKINEFLSNELWLNQYPGIDGVLYMDKSTNDRTVLTGVETVVFVQEIYLTTVDNIYINDGADFKSIKDDVTILTPPTIDMDILKCTLNKLTSNNPIMVGGYHEKYLKYKKKYLALKNLTN